MRVEISIRTEDYDGLWSCCKTYDEYTARLLGWLVAAT